MANILGDSINFQLHMLNVLNNESSSKEKLNVLEEKYFSWTENALEKYPLFLWDIRIKQKIEARDEVLFSLIASSSLSKSSSA